jgi:hypothetical protein
MSELATRRRLEGTLNMRTTGADWRHLKRAWAGPARTLSSAAFVHEVEENWQDFVAFAKDNLWCLRCYEEDTRREQAGELEELELEEEPPANTPLAPATLSGDRTFARARALGSLNLLRTGGRSSGRAGIHGTLFPRGGVDGTLAQWVYVVAAELWVPAEEVANNYRNMQKTMSAESIPPKTSERAFEVAAFVWDNERVHGTRPPWPVLCERWNNWPLTEPFKKWQSFHKAFARGAKATPPRYVATNEQMTELVRSRSHQGAFDM